MLGVLWTGWHWLQSKAVIYGLGAVAVAFAIWRVSSGLITSGQQQERLKQLENQAKARKANAQIQATNASKSTDDLRSRMQRDYSSDDK